MEGIVVVGKGHSAAGSQSLWDLYREKSGMALVPGTLNVQVPEPCDLPDTASRLSAEEWGGHCDVILAKCSVDGHSEVIIRTVENEDGSGPVEKTIFEIASDIHFRKELGWKDG